LKQILVIKTSSLGDVIHTLPALTDAAAAIPGITFDWVVEENIAEVPAWHPAVRQVLPVALRRWRRGWWQSPERTQRSQFTQRLRAREYDAVIDAQGLIKSAWISWSARGPRHALSWTSAREPLSSLAAHHRHPIAKGQHAIARVRQLFARSLGYPCPTSAPDYGIDRSRFLTGPPPEPTIVFLHGTTWPTKHWPEESWTALAGLAAADGYDVRLPWGNPAEKARADRIAKTCPRAQVLPRMSLAELAGVLATARGVVAVDTGLAHVAAALGVPAVTLYGATTPGLTGTLGRHQVSLQARFGCAPCLRRTCNYSGPSPVHPACYQTLPPALVWATLKPLVIP